MQILHGLDIDVKMREINVAKLRRERKPDDKILVKEEGVLAEKKQALQALCVTCGYMYGSYGKVPTPADGAPPAKRVKTSHSPTIKESEDAIAGATEVATTPHTAMETDELAHAVQNPDTKPPSPGLVRLGNEQIPGVRAASATSISSPRSSLPDVRPSSAYASSYTSPPPSEPLLQTPHSALLAAHEAAAREAAHPVTTGNGNDTSNNEDTSMTDTLYGWDGVTRGPAGEEEDIDDITTDPTGDFTDKVADYSAFMADDSDAEYLA